jgi:hypothetical protein
LAYSFGALALALRARRTAQALKGQPFSRGALSALAVLLAWVGFLVLLGMAAIAGVDIVRGIPPTL